MCLKNKELQAIKVMYYAFLTTLASFFVSESCDFWKILISPKPETFRVIFWTLCLSTVKSFFSLFPKSRRKKVGAVHDFTFEKKCCRLRPSKPTLVLKDQSWLRFHFWKNTRRSRPSKPTLVLKDQSWFERVNKPTALINWFINWYKKIV